MSFVNLQVRSCFSLLQSSVRIPDLVSTAKAMGYESLALTDLNSMYGAVSFYRAAKSAGIKPILGLTIDLPGLVDVSQQYQVIFLAKNNRGYHQLFKLSSEKMTRSDLSWEQIKPLLTDVIMIIPPASGETDYLLKTNDVDLHQAWRQRLNQLSEQVDVYLGISTRNLSRVAQQRLQQIAQALALPLVALDDVRYLKESEAFTNVVLQAIDNNQQLDQPIQQAGQRGTYYLDTPEGVADRYHLEKFDDAVKNSVSIAEKCQIELEFKRAQLPKFPVPKDMAAAQYLEKLAQFGLKKRLQDKDLQLNYQDRLKRELIIINEMGFADYFLIVWDVVRYAHKKGIMTGPGRGSAAGSLVAFALGITDVDPLKYQLLFERFLNPERISMPDIDLDIPDNRRNELIHYMHDRYGNSHMAQIITFGTMAAKGALRDVGRVFGLSQTQMNEWSKSIPNQLNLGLKGAYQQSEGLKNLVAFSSENQLLFKTALAIEGLPRHYSTHAAGIVLSAENLTDTVPVQSGTDDIRLTQFPKDDVEALGLLKIDFLGLRNLTTLAEILQLVSPTKVINPRQIPLDDQSTLALFRKGETDGIFQFESSGIRQVLIKLKPTSFADIVATNALYRPGPMENINEFIARKNGQQPITYPDDALASVLKDTYGILVYQEQVMQVAVLMGGFSMAQADSLRRAVSKKKKSELDAAKQQFLDGAQKQNFSLSVAETVYAYIEKFANYGFNKSHAVAYSMIAFWLAYLRVHFPAAFFVAQLRGNQNNSGKTAAYIQELRADKVEILGPDINKSEQQFSLAKSQVRFGLNSIKGLRTDMVQQIISERHEHGSYRDLSDFLKRLPERFHQLPLLTVMAQVGCFDSFDQNRQQTVQNINNLNETLQLAGNSISLFDVLAPKKVIIADYMNEERLNLEKELLGVYLSGHPLENYQQAAISKRAVAITNLSKGTMGILVYLRQIKVIRTKRGEPMAFVQAEDLSAEIEITVFPQVYHQFQGELAIGTIIFIKGHLEDKPRQSGQTQFIAETIQSVSSDSPTATLFLKLVASPDRNSLMKKLETIFLDHQGFSNVVIYLADQKKSRQLEPRFRVKITPELLSKLGELLGPDNVVAKT